MVGVFEPGAVFALLDDCEASAAGPTSRLYTNHIRTHTCLDPRLLEVTWSAVEADQGQGLHAVLLADYEWGAALLQAGHERWTPKDLGRSPSLSVLMFRELQFLSAAQVDRALGAAEGCPEPSPAGITGFHPEPEWPAFEAALARIQRHLRAGDTYQVNHTLRLEGRTFGSPLALYRRLRAAQPVRYGAFAALEEGRHVLSLSPELFVAFDGTRLLARPMKGTAPRSGNVAEDARRAEALGQDRKNRAENVMIVDLLRNDLGRVAAPGSVQVRSLFAVEAHPTLFQMTSTLEATPRPGTSFPDLLRALFPCGSITGAPKHRTMQLIADLERSPRGLYCGAIGWVDAPSGGALGACCLSVAIRTLELEGSDPQTVRLGVGAGIVLDSEARSEFAEVCAKARFLTDLDPGFQLLETLLVQPGQGIRHLDAHLARLARSTEELGFACEPEALRQDLAERVRQLPSQGEARLRLTLSKQGQVDLQVSSLEALPQAGSAQDPLWLALAPEPLCQAPLLAGHKTTWRPQYDPALRQAQAMGCFDLIFLNAAGELVEGARSSLFLRLGGRWCTPPLASGALPGIFRQHLLDDPAWDATERTLRREHLQQAEAIVVCNALRGALWGRFESSW